MFLREELVLLITHSNTHFHSLALWSSTNVVSPMRQQWNICIFPTFHSSSCDWVMQTALENFRNIFHSTTSLIPMPTPLWYQDEALRLPRYKDLIKMETVVKHLVALPTTGQLYCAIHHAMKNVDSDNK